MTSKSKRSGKAGKVQAPRILEEFSSVQRTEEEWAAHDEAVRRSSLAATRREAAQALAVRVKKIIAGGAPPGLVELVASGPLRKDLEVMSDVAKWQTSGRRVLVLSGPVGTGKTVAAVRWLMNHGGQSPCFTRAGDFEARGRYSHVWRDAWQNATGMVLDDMGAEYKDTKGNLLADLDTLIDTYAVGRGKLVITTNLTWEDFQERYEERIASRIVGSSAWVTAGGRDMRRPAP